MDSRGKIAILLLVIVLLSMSVAFSGCTSQGPKEQQRPAENQSPPAEDSTEQDKQ
jgi:hypothetical protein